MIICEVFPLALLRPIGLRDSGLHHAGLLILIARTGRTELELPLTLLGQMCVS